MELLNDACSTSAIGCGVSDLTSSTNHIGSDMVYVLLLGASLLSYGITIDTTSKIEKIDNKLFMKMKKAANMSLLIVVLILFRNVENAI